MLNYCCNMEDEIKIFVAGAKKIAKIKGYTQTDIATGVKGIDGTKGIQATISSYFTGKTRPKPIMMEAIANFLKVPYEEILQAGREAQVPEKFKEFDEERIRKIVREETQGETTKPLNDLEEYKFQKKHHRKIEEFLDHEKAFQLNEIAVELEKIDPKEIDKAIDYLRERLEISRILKGPSRTAAPGEENKPNGTGS